MPIAHGYKQLCKLGETRELRVIFNCQCPDRIVGPHKQHWVGHKFRWCSFLQVFPSSTFYLVVLHPATCYTHIPLSHDIRQSNGVCGKVYNLYIYIYIVKTMQLYLENICFFNILRDICTGTNVSSQSDKSFMDFKWSLAVLIGDQEIKW